jgi:tetratricopeptide (TPR) repeat protein
MPTDDEILVVKKAESSLPSSLSEQRSLLLLLAKETCLGSVALRLSLTRALTAAQGGASFSFDSVAASVLAEQSFLAEVDGGELDRAEKALRAMEAAFPAASSPKTSLYQAHFAAASGDVARADELLTTAIERFPTSRRLAAARVSLHRDAGKSESALELAGDYTARYPDDADGWLECAEQYAAGGFLDKALFCLDQTLLLRPTSVGLWTRKGELCYAAGGPANVRAAATAFARAVELTNDSRLDLRALWSLYVSLRRGGGQAGGPASELTVEVGKRLTAAYADRCPSLLVHAENVLETI